MKHKNKNNFIKNPTENAANEDIKIEPQNISEYALNIPEDEIWTYQVEGLSVPHIRKPYTHYRLRQIVFSSVIIVAIILSCYFSIRAVQSDTFKYNTLKNGTYEFVKFSNTGSIKNITVNYVTDIVYDKNDNNAVTSFSLIEDTSKPITHLHEYAFNCDEKLETITIGENVTHIDGKSIYTCKNLKNIYVDDNNPNYCDIDGVLYNKDKTEIICYPINHDTYLHEKFGYKEKITADKPDYEKYKNDVLTYVLPSTVEKIGQLCFNYSALVDVYLPEGLKTIETLGFFRSTALNGIFTYKTDKVITNTQFISKESFKEIYFSLPEGLEYIGSDAFSYNQAMDYVYIPSSVTYIGHHAFWETVYKKDGNICGVSEINVENDKDTFESQTKLGNQWRPSYDYMLFKKAINVIYSAQRTQ